MTWSIAELETRFMMLCKPGRVIHSPPTGQEMGAVGSSIQEMAAAGALIATDGLQESSNGARVRLD